jgi:hypothetical protein
LCSAAGGDIDARCFSVESLRNSNFAMPWVGVRGSASTNSA